MIASGIPTMAPTIVRLTTTPTIIRTIPRIIATRRPVISTITATNFQIAAEEKGPEIPGNMMFCLSCHFDLQVYKVTITLNYAHSTLK